MADADRPQKGQKFSRREFIRVAGLGTVGLLATACGGGAQAPAAPAEPQVVEKVVEKEKVVEVEKVVTATAPAAAPADIVATSQMTVDTWNNSLERAKERYPEINLTVTNTQIGSIGWSGYSDLILTQIAGGEQLDVIMIAIEGLRLLTAKNVLKPLDEFLTVDTEAKEIIDTDVHKTLREMLQVDGKQMEYPFSWNNMVMYYNTAIFEEAGIDPPKPDWNWDDFLETSLKVANVTGGADDRYAYSFWGNSMFGMHAWLFNNDTAVFNPEWTDSNLTDPKVIETVQFLADLILKHKVAPNPTGWNEAEQFHAGHLAMRTCGRWCIGASLEAKFDTYDLQYQPHQAGSIKTVAGTDGWGIANVTEYPDQAWNVVKLLSGPEASLDMVKLGGNIPALKSVAEMPEFKEFGPPNTAVFYESLEAAATVPSPTNFNIVEPIMNRHLATIWNGEKAVEEALQEAHNEIQTEMDKLKS
jgi:multiple sugar transport system substrate-binding protein